MEHLLDSTCISHPQVKTNRFDIKITKYCVYYTITVCRIKEINLGDSTDSFCAVTNNRNPPRVREGMGEGGVDLPEGRGELGWLLGERGGMGVKGGRATVPSDPPDGYITSSCTSH
jgi:hypothetical protein